MSRPKIVAHRGANVDLPEQSLAAYVRAIEVGADAVECDVRLTKDGHLVCHHDRTVDRTSDGTGAISDLTLAELQKLNFAGPRSRMVSAKTATTQSLRPGSHANTEDHHQILPLDTLLRVVRDAPRPVEMYIETKHPTRYGQQAEIELHNVLKGFPDITATVMSFARAAVTRYRRLDPERNLVWLFEYPIGSSPAGTNIIGPGLEAIDAKPEIIERAHRAGLQVYAWTANTPEDVEALCRRGVDAIATDDPAMALATIHGMAPRTGAQKP